MRGHIRKRSKNSWAVVVELPRDPETGKRRQRWVTVRGTKKDAERVLAGLLVEAGSGLANLPSSLLTVERYLHTWLEGSRHTVRNSTLHNYRDAVKAFIPLIGAIPLSKLSAIDVQKAVADLSTTLNPNSVRTYLVRLKAALNQAVKWDMLARNPAKGVKLPACPPAEVKVWTEVEASKFLGATTGYRYHVLFWLALHTGMRQGELLALRWTDLDLKGGAVYVRRTATRDGGTNAPKTLTGQRKILIDPQTVEKLVGHRKCQMEECLKRGEGWTQDMLVFTSRAGKQVCPKFLTKNFKKITKRLGLKQMSFHALRHTHATILLRQGVNPKTVAERLGHKSVVITLDTYSHLLPDTQREAVLALTRAMQTGG